MICKSSYHNDYKQACKELRISYWNIGGIEHNFCDRPTGGKQYVSPQNVGGGGVHNYLEQIYSYFSVMQENYLSTIYQISI